MLVDPLSCRGPWSRVLRPVLVGVLVTLLAASMLSNVAGATTKITVATSQSELVALRQVKWTSNVMVKVGNGSWTFTSSGVPASRFVATHYAVPANPFDVSAVGAGIVATASVLTDQHYDYTLAQKPRYSKTVTAANQGPIGVLLDGAALYNPYEANHATVATSDNFTVTSNGVTASFLDSCDGHPGPGGQYHYHGLPSCLVSDVGGATASVVPVTSSSGSATTGVDETNATTKRPIILGFAFDGFGIYDNVAMSGAVVAVSALDACNGIFSPVPGYRHGVYHYVLENVKGVRSSINCYHGVVSSAYTRALQSLLEGPSASVGAISVVGSHVRATAESLAANTSLDTFYRTMIRLRGLNNDC
jgi:hypothetical protein